MRIKRLITAAAFASLVAIGGGSAVASASVHPGATAACGSNCQVLSSFDLGPSVILNGYVAGDTGAQISHGHQVVNMKYASNERPNADWRIEKIGTVGQYCHTLLNLDGFLNANSVACTHYAGSPAYEWDFAPNGNESGYCAGTTGTPFNGLKFRLTQCGSTEGTLLIQENAPAGTPAGYFAYISGATQSFSHPWVATVVEGTSHPDNQVQLAEQNTLTGGAIRSSQLFKSVPGPVA